MRGDRLGLLDLAILLTACGGAPAAPAPARPASSTRQIPSAPAPDAPLASIDITQLPTGPFASAQEFCTRWLAVKNRGVAELEARCASDPSADGCPSDCGPESTCTITHLAGAVGPFRSAELVEVFEPCGPGNCLLALGTADGVWLADEVSQCSGGEGFSASLATRAVTGDGGALVWRYDHAFGEPPVIEHEQATVRCSIAASRPSCARDP